MIDIRFEEDNSRAAAYDGDEMIGEAGITVSSGVWRIEHTEVDPAYQGRKIGEQLVAAVVENARTQGATIVPVCPYALHQFEKRSEYQDVWERPAP